MVVCGWFLICPGSVIAVADPEGVQGVHSNPLPTPVFKYPMKMKQVAQWATIAHLGASIMFKDTIIDDAQRRVTLNLKQ